jgi:hypothetical protein
MPAARVLLSRDPENTFPDVPKRGVRGRWVPGSSPNPGGRPAGMAEVRDLARSYTAIAIEKLAHLVQHAKSEQACIAAASELLSRGWGKPTQPIAGDDDMPAIGINGTAVATLTAEERAALVAAITESLRGASS